MQDITIWKLVSDGLLFAALAYLAYRISRSEGATAKVPRLLELEASLKRILSEADQVGNGLNKQLQARQRDLEKLLYDMETVEQRVNRALSNADERKNAIEIEVQRARNVLEEMGSANAGAERYIGMPQRRTAETPVPMPSPSVEQVVPEQPYRERRDAEAGMIRRRQYAGGDRPARPIEAEMLPEPASFRAEPDSLDEAPPQETRRAERPEKRGVRYNIYGQPISEPPPAAPAPKAQTRGSGLAKSIEKTVQPAAYGANDAAKARLDDIYFAAEELLRAGKNIEFVAQRTRLPVDEVKMLQQMVQRQSLVDGAPQGVRKDDPRLGVLSSANRAGQTV